MLDAKALATLQGSDHHYKVPRAWTATALPVIRLQGNMCDVRSSLKSETKLRAESLHTHLTLDEEKRNTEQHTLCSRETKQKRETQRLLSDVSNEAEKYRKTGTP